MATKTDLAEIARQHAKGSLRAILDAQEQPRIYTILRHVSASGMTRDISLIAVEDGRIRNVSGLVARVLGEKVREAHGHWAIRVSGCGMDMGWGLVHRLSAILYSDRERGAYVIHHDWL